MGNHRSVLVYLSVKNPWKSWESSSVGDGVFLHVGCILLFPIRCPDSSITGSFVVVQQLWHPPRVKEGEHQPQRCQTLTGRKLVTDQVECVDAATCPGKGKGGLGSCLLQSAQSQELLPVHLTMALETHLGLPGARLYSIFRGQRLAKTCCLQNILPAKTICTVTGGAVVGRMGITFTQKD